MNIVHFVSFGIGGADRAALELVKAQIGLGMEVEAVFGPMSHPKRTSDQDASQPLLSIYSEYKKICKLREINDASELNLMNIEVLHTHRSGEDGWLIPGLLRIERNFKIVETNFHGYQETPADFRIYPSEALMSFRGIAKSSRNEVIPNVVNTIDGKSLRNSMNLNNRVVLGRVGRSDHSIYSAELLRAYAKVESDETVLIWVGRSSWAESDAAKYKIKNIQWVDPIADPTLLARYYSTFDIFCHVNKLGETFGNTVAEAMWRGVPIVSLKGSKRYPQAQQELLKQDQFTENFRDFKRNLQSLIRLPEKRTEIGKANSTFAKYHLNPAIIAKKVSKIYEDLAK
jgi:glycosyltransferase involved in cell wall biosynthesis